MLRCNRAKCEKSNGRAYIDNGELLGLWDVEEYVLLPARMAGACLTGEMFGDYGHAPQMINPRQFNPNWTASQVDSGNRR